MSGEGNDLTIADVDRLKAAAREFWGDDGWTVKIKHWADGTTGGEAVRAVQLDDDDENNVIERLYILEEGVRVTREERDIEHINLEVLQEPLE